MMDGLFREIYPLAVGEEMAYRIMGKNIIPSWFLREGQRFSFLSLKQIIPPIPYNRETLEKCKDDHILFLGVDHINNQPLTLKTLMIEKTPMLGILNNSKDYYAELADYSANCNFRWYLIKKESDVILPDYETAPMVAVLYSTMIFHHFNHNIEAILFPGQKIKTSDGLLNFSSRTICVEGDSFDWIGVYMGPLIEDFVEGYEEYFQNLKSTFALVRKTDMAAENV